MEKKNINQITNYDIYYVSIEPLLKKKKISKNSLCKMTGIAYNALQRYCKSEIKRADSDVISRICCALQCEIEEIIIKD